jgi:predicted nicotinamide N-methyase
MFRKRHARLLARIHRRFRTLTATHAVGPLRLPFTRIEDPDAVLDQIVIAEDRREKLTGDRRDGNALHLPYWAELWDSTLGIGTLLADQFDKVTTRLSSPKSRWQGDKVKRMGANSHLVTPSPCHLVSVLDLGCGMGFTGMVAAAMGASVLFADLEPDALLFARLNSLRWAPHVRTRKLDWQKDRLNEQFDLILGADVLYDRKQWDFLDPFFKTHLAEHGTVLLGEPGRHTSDDFPTWIAARGWKLKHLEQHVATRATPIRIFSLQRS